MSRISWLIRARPNGSRQGPQGVSPTKTPMPRIWIGAYIYHLPLRGITWGAHAPLSPAQLKSANDATVPQSVQFTMSVVVYNCQKVFWYPSPSSLSTLV